MARRFTRRSLPAARAWVDSIYSAGGLTGRRHPSTWSDTYLLRVANATQQQAAAGKPLSLQAARRGQRAFEQQRAREQQAGRRLPGLERPPGVRYVGPRLASGEPDREHGVGFDAKQYRSPRAMVRYVAGLDTERVQILGYGPLAENYRTFGADDDDAEPERGWRILYTGDRRRFLEDEDLREAILAGYATRDGDERTPALDHVERFEVRSGPGIGD